MRHAIRLLIPILLFAVPARAQWTVDGVGVCTASGNQNQPKIASDGAGGWIMTWTDSRSGTQDIYAQRVDGTGTPLWTANGVVVCSAANTQIEPRIVSDGNEGAIVTWQDGRTGTYDIYAQLIDPGGAAVWAANGVPICTAPDTQQLPEIVADAFGGAVITWSDLRNGGFNPDIYAQRINVAGVAQWTANGVPICNDPGYQDAPTLILAGYNSIIIAWGDQRYGNTDVYAQRMNLAGASQWTANGVPVCTALGFQDGIVMVGDFFGGAILAWRDTRSGPVNADIYAQRINSAGVIQWTYDGIPIHTGAQDYGEARKAMISDGAGGAFIVWEDWRSNNFYDIYAQRVNSAGLVLWLPNGVAVSTAANNQLSPVIASDASNGTVISWQDLRTGSGDIYAQRLNYAGFPQWAANGVPVCTATGNQRSPAMLEEGSGGAVIAWEDTRSGAYDIYAQRLIATGESCAFVVTRTTDDDTPGSLRTAIRQANVVPGPQSVSFNIPGPGPHTITLTSQLPAITDGLVIDGFTQPGASSNTNAVGSPCNAHIMIDIHGGFTGDGFKFQAPGTLRGVATHSFLGRDVLVQADPVVIEGNYIGLDAGGYGGWLNQTGIWIQANHCRVGGATAAARNVITEGSYQTTGIQIEGAWYAQIYGNYIGTMTDLTDGGLGNATGVLIQSGGRSNTLGLNEGTLNHEEANVIAYNGTAVSIKGAGTIDNGVFGNSFRGNTTFGIDLAGDGRTPNDVGDGDDGPNHLQNYPVLSGATGTQVTGDMHGKPGDSVILNFYRSTGCSPGNGEVYLGNQSVNMNGSGDASYTFAPAQPVPPESWITVTARDFFGNTSEMSDCVFSKNTPGGNNVVVNLVDGNNAVRGTATFATVNNNGNTFVTTPYTPPVLISGYAIGNPNDPQIYFNITTNASYTGGVDVCLNYDENNIPGPEANLVLLHYNGTMWANVTTSRDPVNNKICGHVTSLSPFVIGAVTTTGVQDKPTPNRLALHANVPNPFNPITTISYDVPAHGADVNISIYDVSGRLVRDLVHEHRTAGVWSVEWNGEDDRGQRVASGVYFYRMRAGAFVDTKKMVLLK